jgi:hypothetical protein
VPEDPIERPRIPSFGIPPEMLRADMWYCTNEGNVAGGVTITDSLLMFNPLLGDKMKCVSEKNECELSAKYFQAIIDIADIV